MVPVKRAAVFFALSLAVTLSAFAQTAEYGRSGSTLELLTKHGQRLSGSFSLFAGDARGLGATIGGALVPERMWFFGSLQTQSVARMVDANVTAQPSDRQSLTASLAAARPSATTAITAEQPFTGLQVPTSFLALRYTGIISDKMSVSASFSNLKH